MQADTSSSLDDIQDRASSSIVSTLLDLQEHGEFDVRSSDWIENLDIIYPCASKRSRKRQWDGTMVADNFEKKLFRRRNFNAHNRKKRYIALSYTWRPLSDQDSSCGAYLVQSRDRRFKCSRVRDQVFDRAIAFVNYCKYKRPKKRPEIRISGFWIDQECIDQKNEAEKQRAIQSMERVYINSFYSVALLSVRIKLRSHLQDLIYILERTDPPGNEDERRVSGVLDLLEYITSDPWWERGWTFQEDYCASTKMVLLIRHSSSLTELKEENSELLDDLEGELCITSADFRSQATRFCMEYRSQFKERCDKILDRAGKYNVQLLELDREGNATIRKSMSPTIFSNVGQRKIGVESDRLAVIANCLGYLVRLDTKKVERRKCSLSIAMLALFLLNGEILMNDPDISRPALERGIFDYLKHQSLRTFQPPDIRQKLTFIKRCRFPDVQLSEEGILTSGHLWRLGRTVENAKATLPLPGGSGRHLNFYQRKRLDQLARHLSSGELGRRYQPMASAIEAHLDEDETWHSKYITFSKEYKDLMAKEIVKAMDDRRSLRLGCIIPHENHKKSVPYQGIFISEAGDSRMETETYVFTAVRPAEKSIDGIEKHVSLVVKLLSDSPQRGPAQLVIKRWINGLFFFDRSSPITDAVFPWPESLLNDSGELSS